MTRLLVDALNVIRRDSALRELEQRDPNGARTELVRLLGHQTLRQHQIALVFDGAPSPTERLTAGHIRAYYAWNQTADDLIAGMCGSGDIVVTDDRQLIEDTLQAGPKIWTTTRLLEAVRPRKRPTRTAATSTTKPTPQHPPLRRFEVCARCLFVRRDDWLMLCEEDSALGQPRNFREHW
ncbi:MAG: NYN domain-containing protein [Chloroflexota bacterium]|nr:NYN domain-containing protein [Chloroflexota bacterium]